MLWFDEGMAQTKNIKAYATYLEERVASYIDLKMDYVVAADDPKRAARLAEMKWESGSALASMQNSTYVIHLQTQLMF